MRLVGVLNTSTRIRALDYTRLQQDIGKLVDEFEKEKALWCGLCWQPTDAQKQDYALLKADDGLH